MTGPHENCGPDVGASARVGLGVPATETMSNDTTRRQKAVARTEATTSDRVGIGRGDIRERAESAFFATAQPFLSEFARDALDEDGQPDLCPSEAEVAARRDGAAGQTVDGRRVATDGGYAEPDILDAVPAPDGYECKLWTGEEPSPCEQDADWLFVYDGNTGEETTPRNCLACHDCFKPGSDAERREVATDGGEK